MKLMKRESNTRIKLMEKPKIIDLQKEKNFVISAIS